MNREDLVQVDPEHYDFSYDTRKRFIGYWHQINEVMNLDPEQVLKIGVGNKTVADQLRKYGVKVVSLDIDKRLNPNIVGDVKKLPFKSKSFEVITCFEVLEHIPFEYFRDTLKELKRVTKSHIVMSLPDSGKYFSNCWKT